MNRDVLAVGACMLSIGLAGETQAQPNFSAAIKAAFNISRTAATDPATSVPILLTSFVNPSQPYTIPSSTLGYITDPRVYGFKIDLGWVNIEPQYHVMEWQSDIVSALAPTGDGVHSKGTLTASQGITLAVGDTISGCGYTGTITYINLPNFNSTPSASVEACTLSVVNPTSPLQLLIANVNASNQVIGLGVDTGDAAPSWLATSLGVPIPQTNVPGYPIGGAFFTGGFQSQNQSNCSQWNLPIAWDANYVSEWEWANDQLLAYLHSTMFLGTNVSLLSRLRVIDSTGMVVLRNEQTGVPNGGCQGTLTIGNTVYNINQQDTDTAAILLDHSRMTNTITEADDTYSQAKAISAYEAMVSHLATSLSSYGTETAQTVIRVGLGGGNTASWPLIGAQGQIEQSYGNDIRVVDTLSAWLIANVPLATGCYNEASLATPGEGSPTPPAWYVNFAQNGMNLCAQMNGNATPSGQPGGSVATSCHGKHDGIFAGPICMAAIWALYGFTSGERAPGQFLWAEVRGNDFLYGNMPTAAVLP
jgi:hypothetical protein